MSDQEFRRLSCYIYEFCGINMPPSKKTMLEARLQKRLRSLGLKNFKDYEKLLFSQDAGVKELPLMINVVTTNKTEFFREPVHFEYLAREALPELIGVKRVGERAIRLWSAGCSSGEEPYTIAMVLNEFSDGNVAGYSILATDISSAVLEKARLGIYYEESISPVPQVFRQKYFLKSRDRIKKLVRVVPKLRTMVEFRQLNFKSEEFRAPRTFDIIFCRNVIIYFDKQTQGSILTSFYNHLAPGGYLFLGHSETLSGFDIPLKQVASTVYRKS
jgi:chemotaxis protein methyltransferase CheR